MCSISCRCALCATVVHDLVHSNLLVRWLVPAFGMETEAILRLGRDHFSTGTLSKIAEWQTASAECQSTSNLLLRSQQFAPANREVPCAQIISSERCVQHEVRDGRRCPGGCYPNTNPNHDDIPPISTTSINNRTVSSMARGQLISGPFSDNSVIQSTILGNTCRHSPETILRPPSGLKDHL